MKVMTKAQEMALEAYPVVFRSNYADNTNGFEQYLEDNNRNNLCRKVFEEGYEQAEKDITFDKMQLHNKGYILTKEDCEGVMDAFFDYIHDISCGRASAQQTKEALYEEVLRRFNESKK